MKYKDSVQNSENNKRILRLGTPVYKHHKRILDTLRQNIVIDHEVRENKLTFWVADEEDEEDEEGGGILQEIVRRLTTKTETALQYNDATKDFIDWILNTKFELLYRGNHSEKGPLEIAAKCGKNDVCPDLLGLLCKNRKEIRVHWGNLLEEGSDSCLHLAIRARQTRNAIFLVRKIKESGEAESVLGHRGRNNLTPLQLAVNYKYLTANQDMLIEELIDAYPDALFLCLSDSCSKAGDSRQNCYQKKDNKKSKDIQGSLPPLLYFNQTKDEQLRYANGRQEPKRNLSAVADRIHTLLMLNCMRYGIQTREQIMKVLPNDAGHISLDLTPGSKMSMRLLDRLLKIRHFENILLYVSIPNLRIVDNIKGDSPEQDRDMQLNRGRYSNRKDYAYIFNWLRSEKVGVKRILRIKVDDSDEAAFHNDEAIEQALSGFEVESWDWKRADICSNVIQVAAPGVRDLTLYWSGNNTVLRSWAAEDGLVQLKELRSIHIIRQKTIESSQRTEDNVCKFETDFKNRWEGIPDRKQQAPFINFPTDKEEEMVEIAQNEARKYDREQKEHWIKNITDFTGILKKYLANNKDKNVPIKVAVIDDGVMLSHSDIEHNIVDGETFQSTKDGLWPGWHQSSRGHGTLMARLICEICPHAELYIAKLGEKWTHGQSQITMGSAAKAIEWARQKEVDIISMSWTIENADEGESELKEAIRMAAQDNILLFCASNDRGNQSSKLPYPARYPDTYCIGAATDLGFRENETQPLVDYVVPGTWTEEDDVSMGTERVKGSSIATARCAGLAALILQCIACGKDEEHKKTVRNHEHMRNIFDHLIENQYIQVSGVLKLKPGKNTIDYEGDVLKTVADKLFNYSEIDVRRR